MGFTDRTLLARALGLLDPGDVGVVDQGLGADERLRLSGLAALAGAPVAVTDGALSAERTTGGLLDAAGAWSRDALADARQARVGERVSFQLRWPALPPDARCAIFRRVDGEVQRLYPRSSAWSPLSRFRRAGGNPLLELVVEPPAGLQLLDVVLVSGSLADTPWPDGSPAWERLHHSYLEGKGYGVTLELEVG